MLGDRLSDRHKKVLQRLRPDKLDSETLFASAILNNSKIHIKGNFVDVVVSATDLTHPDTDYFIFRAWEVISAITKDCSIQNQLLEIHLPFKAISKAFHKKGIDVLSIEDNEYELIIDKKSFYKYEIVRFERIDEDEL
jgi:hypothetical protein